MFDLMAFVGGRAVSLVWDGDLLEPDGLLVGVDKKDPLRLMPTFSWFSRSSHRHRHFSLGATSWS